MKKTKIGAILVLYNPNIEEVLLSINTLAPQVDELCLIDNTPDQDIHDIFRSFENIHYIPLFNNVGIATAQNVGIKYFECNNFDFVLFSDQDSLAPKNLVSNLLIDFYRLQQEGINVGLVGPLPINKHTGKPYHNRKKYIKDINVHNELYIECQSIISSFSLIPLVYFKKIGLYKDELFIDFVENEWCFRIREMLGVSAYISTRLTIQHELGKSKKFLWFNISISSPFRIYFQVRNYLWLRKKSYVSVEWKKQTFRKLILKLLYYPIFPQNRWDYIKRIFNGFRDGSKFQI